MTWAYPYAASVNAKVGVALVVYGFSDVARIQVAILGIYQFPVRIAGCSIPYVFEKSCCRMLCCCDGWFP
jgi:hypothetical protein